MSTMLRLEVSRKTGGELFHAGNDPLGFNLLAFWQWSASDLTSNALRGRLAEFLVAQALGIAGGIRAEWDAFDLCTANGLTIEVKSAAYLQSWSQKSPSAICFGIRPTRSWDADTNQLALESRRQAHLYVFALLSHRDKATLDPFECGAMGVLCPTVCSAKRTAAASEELVFCVASQTGSRSV